MSSRKTHEGTQNIYEATDLWIERALKSDDSLFTPGEPIWTPQNLNELHQRYLNRPDEGRGGFWMKLEIQLDGSPAEVYQLMSEALYVYYLYVVDIKRYTKEDRVNQILRWSGRNIMIPNSLSAGLEPGIASFGAGRNWITFYLGFLIEFVEQWKQQRTDEQQRLLDKPWEFKSFVAGLEFQSVLMRLQQKSYGIQREALYHLVHPDTFEGIVNADWKRSISGAEAFDHYVTDGATDIDRRIYQIRRGLEADMGNDFYDFEDVRWMWDPDESPPTSHLWGEYISRAKTYHSSGLMKTEEINYKVKIGEEISAVREAVLNNVADWVNQLDNAIPRNNPIGWRARNKFLWWVEGSPENSEVALQALKAVWAEDNSSYPERIRAFVSLLPSDALEGSKGVQARFVATLLMGLDVHKYPPYAEQTFRRAYELTGYGRSDDENSDAATEYAHALGFLDKFIEEAKARDLKLNSHLEAQSLVWALDSERDKEVEESETPVTEIIEETSSHKVDLDALADELYLTADFLREIRALLEEKRQVIFQGPPGTGKTYVAKKLAERLSGADDRVTLVQFHPSYAYEDFIEGYRPIPLENGQLGFKLTPGPLKRIAKKARCDKNRNYYLIIDEINRGNLAKIFGELYFLLEYRNEKINLQYSAEPFSLPENLYIIGTMNTADRSIALVDLALRRRFNFVEFHPDDEPIKGLLRRYLRDKAPGMDWVADVVERANEKLKDDRHAAIGPSYFMKDGLDDAAVERIWKHSVLPYVEELLFGRDDGLSEFSLAKLRQGSDQDGAENLGGSE